MFLRRERSSVSWIQWKQKGIWMVKVTQSQNKTWSQELKASKQDIMTRICMLCAGIWRLGHANFMMWRLFCALHVCACVYKRECPWTESKREEWDAVERILLSTAEAEGTKEKWKQRNHKVLATTSIHLLLLTTNNAQTEERKIEQPKKKDVSC